MGVRDGQKEDHNLEETLLRSLKLSTKKTVPSHYLSEYNHQSKNHPTVESLSANLESVSLTLS